MNETNVFAVHSFIDGTHKRVDDAQSPVYPFFDVRDVVRAHVIALTVEAAAGKHLLQVSGLIAPRLVSGIIGKHFPRSRSRLPDGWEEWNEGYDELPKRIKRTRWYVSAISELRSKGGKQ